MINREMKCRVCGCTDNQACHHPNLGNCWWVEEDLCSHCAMIGTGEMKKKDVTHLCSDTSCVYHACMSDECQFEEMNNNGAKHFARKCNH